MEKIIVDKVKLIGCMTWKGESGSSYSQVHNSMDGTIAVHKVGGEEEEREAGVIYKYDIKTGEYHKSREGRKYSVRSVRDYAVQNGEWVPYSKGGEKNEQ